HRQPWPGVRRRDGRRGRPHPDDDHHAGVSDRFVPDRRDPPVAARPRRGPRRGGRAHPRTTVVSRADERRSQGAARLVALTMRSPIARTGPLLTLGGISLVAGLTGALVLIGLAMPSATTRLAGSHGLLMTLGFLGT